MSLFNDNRKSAGVSAWDIFDRPVTRDDFDALGYKARRAALLFEQRFASSLSPVDFDTTSVAKDRELDTWVESREGQQMLVALVRDLQKRTRQVGEAALPAHDLRQILYKDACEGLRFAAMEKPQGYKSSFIVPMCFHDLGRLLEGHLYPLGVPHQNWIPHGQLSFLMMKEVLDGYPDMPQRLKDHYQYAVLAHSGENAKTYIGRAVQTCDRMQLVGPEGFFRAISYAAGLLGGDIAYPRTQAYQMHPPELHDHTSAIAIIEHYGRNGYPNIGDDHFEWQQYVQTLNTAVLLRMAEASPDLATYLLAPETQSVPQSSLGPNKKELETHAAHTYLNEYPISQAGPVSRDDLARKLIGLIEAPQGAAKLQEHMGDNIRRAVSRLDDDELGYVAEGVQVSAVLQSRLDAKDEQLVCRILDHGSDPVTRVVAVEAATFSRSAVIPVRGFSPHGYQHRGRAPA